MARRNSRISPRMVFSVFIEGISGADRSATTKIGLETTHYARTRRYAARWSRWKTVGRSSASRVFFPGSPVRISILRSWHAIETEGRPAIEIMRARMAPRYRRIEPLNATGFQEGISWFNFFRIHPAICERARTWEFSFYLPFTFLNFI